MRRRLAQGIHAATKRSRIVTANVCRSCIADGFGPGSIQDENVHEFSRSMSNERVFDPCLRGACAQPVPCRRRWRRASSFAALFGTAATWVDRIVPCQVRTTDRGAIEEWPAHAWTGVRTIFAEPIPQRQDPPGSAAALTYRSQRATRLRRRPPLWSPPPAARKQRG